MGLVGSRHRLRSGMGLVGSLAYVASPRSVINDPVPEHPGTTLRPLSGAGGGLWWPLNGRQLFPGGTTAGIDWRLPGRGVLSPSGQPSGDPAIPAYEAGLDCRSALSGRARSRIVHRVPQPSPGPQGGGSLPPAQVTTASSKRIRVAR